MWCFLFTKKSAGTFSGNNNTTIPVAALAVHRLDNELNTVLNINVGHTRWANRRLVKNEPRYNKPDAAQLPLRTLIKNMEIVGNLHRRDASNLQFHFPQLNLLIA